MTTVTSWLILIPISFTKYPPAKLLYDPNRMTIHVLWPSSSVDLDVSPSQKTLGTCLIRPVRTDQYDEQNAV